MLYLLTVIRTTSFTAKAGEDFVHLDTEVQFMSGQTEAAFPVLIINDTLKEPQESFIIQLYERRYDPRSVLSQDNVTIYDDDDASKKGWLKIIFESHNYLKIIFKIFLTCALTIRWHVHV